MKNPDILQVLVVPLAALRDGLASAANVSLRVLPGVDHFFAAGLGALGREVSEWLMAGDAS